MALFLLYRKPLVSYSSIEDVYVSNNVGAYVEVSYEDACGEIRYYFQYNDTTGEITGFNVGVYEFVDIEDIKTYIDTTAQ